jgi:hypothetical protein
VYRIYSKLKNGIMDSWIPQGFAKIAISHYDKSHREPEHLFMSLCSCSGCYHIGQLCSKGCPYMVTKKYERPHRNSKQYDTWLSEFTLQMTQKHLQVVNDDKIERYLNGELLGHEYQPLVNLLADNLKEYQVDRIHHDKIFRDIFLEIRRRVQNNEIERKNNKQMVWDLNGYYYIEMSSLPEKWEEGDKIWDKCMWNGVWILKEKFTRELWMYIKKYECMLSQYKKNDYRADLKNLQQQLDENYGLITMFTLEGDNNG